MNVPRVIDIGAIVARNALPIGGLVFLGWDAAHLVLLYYVDTIVSIALLFLLFFIHGKDLPWGEVSRAKAVLGVAVATLFMVAAFAAVFSIPLVFMIDDVGKAFDDPGFRSALFGQLLASATSFATYNRNLRGRADREDILRKRFAFVTMCWVVVFAAVMFVPWAPALVVAYVGAGIYFELRPPE